MMEKWTYVPVPALCTITRVGKLGTAIFSDEQKAVYRFFLTRPLEGRGPIVLFGMQNPSKADHEQNDSTITRCIGFANRLGARKMLAVNMNPYITKDPEELLRARILPVAIRENQAMIRRAIVDADIVIAAWGALSKKQFPLFEKGIRAIREKEGLQCLGKTKDGFPRHPLYLAADTELEAWP